MDVSEFKMTCSMAMMPLVLCGLGASYFRIQADGGEQAEARMRSLVAKFDEKGPSRLGAVGSQDTPVAKR